jgi:hypothetical protein
MTSKKIMPKPLRSFKRNLNSSKLPIRIWSSRFSVSESNSTIAKQKALPIPIRIPKVAEFSMRTALNSSF